LLQRDYRRLPCSSVFLISNQRLKDFDLHFDSFDQRFAETNRRLKEMKEALRGDLLRFERVIDARVRRLEERL